MGLLFDPSEVFQVAVRIEENGERFYREMAGRFEDPDVKELFSYLAGEEVKHRKFYGTLLSAMEGVEPFEGYPGEYLAYLKAYADEIIFSQEKFESTMKKIADPGAALAFAIAAERDSIFFYREMKEAVPESRRGELDAVIDEEKRHFVQLSRMKKEKNL